MVWQGCNGRFIDRMLVDRQYSLAACCPLLLEEVAGMDYFMDCFRSWERAGHNAFAFCADPSYLYSAGASGVAGRLQNTSR